MSQAQVHSKYLSSPPCYHHWLHSVLSVRHWKTPSFFSLFSSAAASVFHRLQGISAPPPPAPPQLPPSPLPLTPPPLLLVFPVVDHSFYFLFHSLAFLALSEMRFPKVLPFWLRDEPCPVMGPLEATGTGCAQNMTALASLTGLLLPALLFIPNRQGVTCSVTNWRADTPSRAFMVLCSHLTLPVSGQTTTGQWHANFQWH